MTENKTTAALVEIMEEAKRELAAPYVIHPEQAKKTLAIAEKYMRMEEVLQRVYKRFPFLVDPYLVADIKDALSFDPLSSPEKNYTTRLEVEL